MKIEVQNDWTKFKKLKKCTYAMFTLWHCLTLLSFNGTNIKDLLNYYLFFFLYWMSASKSCTKRKIYYPDNKILD